MPQTDILATGAIVVANGQTAYGDWVNVDGVHSFAVVVTADQTPRTYNFYVQESTDQATIVFGGNAAGGGSKQIVVPGAKYARLMVISSGDGGFTANYSMKVAG